MKVLIVTVSAGNSPLVARWVGGYLREQGVEVREMDAVEYLSPFLGVLTKNLSSLGGEVAKKLRELGAWSTKEPKQAVEEKSLRQGIAYLASKLKVGVEEFCPHVVLSCHPFPALLADHLRSRLGMEFLSVGVLTEFGCHPLWGLSKHLDHLVIPNELLESEAAKRGFSSEKLLPFGIPIPLKFASFPSYGKEAIRKALGMDPRCPTVLILGEGMGRGAVGTAVKQLDGLAHEMQIVCVCGNAEQLQVIKGASYEKKVVAMSRCGFTEKLMDAADLLVAQSDGAIAAQAIARGLPMVLTAGGSERSARFLCNNGVAMRVGGGSSLDTVADQFFLNPLRPRSMQDNMEILRRPEASKTLGNFILNLQ